MQGTLNSSTRFIAVSIASGIIFVALVYLLITSVAQSVERSLAQNRAQSYLDILRKTQGFYSSYIVAPAVINGISIDKDFESKKHSIPFPATFMHGLVRELSRQEKDLQFRFFSPFPLIERKDSGFADGFEETAWNAFLVDPKRVDFSKRVSENGIAKLRYALPVRMGKQCVGCHNNFPTSTRTDWKVGDLRGIQAVTIPLNRNAVWSQGKMGPFVVTLIVGLAILFLTFVGGIWLLTTRNSQLRVAKGKIEDLAMTDPLTGKYNRRHFLAEIDERINKNSSAFAVIVLDLDFFKNINDTHGHVVGDQVLQEVGERLSNISPKFKKIARFGGDEFAVLVDTILLDTTSSKEEIKGLAEKVIKELEEPYITDKGAVHSGASLGISYYPYCAESKIELLTQADMALIEAKRAGRGRFLIFDEKLRREVNFGIKVVGEIHKAIEENEFELFYQPKFDISTGRILGLEALIRWNHPVRGLLTPNAFLPYAEENGLITGISDFVAKQAIADIKQWRESGAGAPPVAINLHRDFIFDRHKFFDFLNEVSRDSQLCQSLVFEITEDCIIGRGNDEIMTVISGIKAANIDLSLDDFGTGYASLTHLKDLPVDEYKIDRSFIRDIIDDEQDRAIVKTMIDLSKSLQVRIVAEGIETNEQAELLLDMGCHIGQGFLFSKPVNFSTIAHMLRSNNDAGASVA